MAFSGIIVLGSLITAAGQWPYLVPPDAGMLAGLDSGREIPATGTETGGLGQIYLNYSDDHLWQRTVTQVASNGLFRVDYWLYRSYGNSPAVKPKPNLSILLFRPPGTADNEAPFSETTWESALTFQRQTLRPPVPQSHPAQRALRLIEKALSAAQFFSANATLYEFRGSSNSMEFTAQLPESFPGVRESGGSVARRVRIFLEVGTGRSPWCKCHPVSFVLEHVPLVRDGHVQPTRIILMRDTFLFASGYLAGPSMQWTDRWTSSNSTPRQVNVSLIALPSLQLASRTTTLPGTPVPEQLQTLVNTNGPAPPTNGNPHHQLQAQEASSVRSRQRLTFPRPPRVERSDVELEWLGRSGIELARYILAHPGSGQFGIPFDSLNQKWAGGSGDSNSPVAHIPLENFPLGGGTISLRITDLDRKFNVNLALLAPELLQSGLRLAGATVEQTVAITEALQDWLDADDIPRAAGAESDYYLTLDPPYAAKNGPIDDPRELLLIRGMTPSIFVALTNLFTPVSSRFININTASAQVMQLIPDVDSNMAQAIIQTRAGPNGQEGDADDMPFRSIGELASVPGMTPQIASLLSRYFNTRSSLFEVTVDVKLGRKTRQYVAWLRRDGSNSIQTLKVYRPR